MFSLLDFSGNFWFFYGIPEAPEAFKNLPGARGVIFPKYEPVASHGDPIQAKFSEIPNYMFGDFPNKSYFPQLPFYQFPISETYLDLCATPYYIEMSLEEFLWINESRVNESSMNFPS